MFKILRGNKKGQALVEYALLLLVVTLTATAIFALDEGMRNKIQEIGLSYETDVGLIPEHNPKPEGCTTNDECLELSPPVAKFQVPSPNYKGNELKFIDESYDTDGYIEHYIWSVDGEVIRKTGEQVREEGGLKYTFRYAGNYNVTLLVIDNDGLISNLASKTVTILNRPPTLEMYVGNEDGDFAKNVTVKQGCTAVFYTDYSDPDLPYDELTLFSRFTDQSGVVTTDNTVPYEFIREFPNLGLNSYYVRVQDEDGATASDTVTVNVVPNPTGACKEDPSIEKPKYKIVVHGHYTKDSKNKNVYRFPPGSRATVTPSVEWGSFKPHAEPYYWVATEGNVVGMWYSRTLGGEMVYPSQNTFAINDRDIRVTGMARDLSATTNDPDPSERGMSNTDEVILRVDEKLLDEFRPIPVISLEGKKHPSTKETVREVNVADIKGNVYKTDIESVLSTGTKEKKKGVDIKGVRWKMPDGEWRPHAGENGAIEITDTHGVKKWYYQGKVNSPDTINGPRSFKYTKGGKNKWTYELETINNFNIRSEKNAKKTIKVVFIPNKPPVAVCDPTTAYTVVGSPVNLTAKGSTDPDGPTPLARWKKGNGKWTSWQKVTDRVPQSWTWSSTGTYTVKLQLKDDKGATTDKNCKVVVERPANNITFQPDLNYIESRVDHIGKPLKLRNITSNEKYQFYSGFSAKGYNGGKRSHNGSLTPLTNYVGIDKSARARNKHIQDIDYPTGQRATVFSTFVHVTDSTGRSNGNQCIGGTLKDVRIDGKNLKNACSKGTHFFRMQEYTKKEVNPKTGKMRERTYCSVHPDGDDFGWYQKKYNRGSGLYDSFGGFSIERSIKSMLNRCRK